jgi:2'-5' RNA ligase
VPVPRAEPLVDQWRRNGDWSHGVGVPAHVTLAGQFQLSEELRLGPLAEMARRVRGTPFTLDEFGCLGNAVCLLSSEEDLLLRIREEAVEAAGLPHPKIDQRFHLTVARGASEVDVGAMRAEIRPSLPLRCEVGDIVVATYEEGHLSLVSLVDTGRGDTA